MSEVIYVKNGAPLPDSPKVIKLFILNDDEIPDDKSATASEYDGDHHMFVRKSDAEQFINTLKDGDPSFRIFVIGYDEAVTKQ
jgi:hypothetical protein